MPTEPIQIRTRRGVARDGTAEVVRVGAAARWGRAVGIAVAGTGVGLATIVVPTVHLLTVWGVPLLSFVVAGYTLSLRGSVRSVAGTCPTCEQPFTLGDQGPLSNDAIWALCPSCRQQIEVVVR